MQKITFFLKDTSHLIICSFLSFQYHRKCRSRAIKAADNPPATGNVTNHASTIFLKSFQSTPCRDLNQPTNTIDPTLQWVVDMGIPMLEAKRTVNADPTSIQKPLKFRNRYQIRFEVKFWFCFHVNIGVEKCLSCIKELDVQLGREGVAKTQFCSSSDVSGKRCCFEKSLVSEN